MTIVLAGKQPPEELDFLSTSSRKRTARSRKEKMSANNANLLLTEGADNDSSSGSALELIVAQQPQSFAEAVAREHLSSAAGRRVALGILKQTDDEVILFK
jgi:hypothetical protein